MIHKKLKKEPVHLFAFQQGVSHKSKKLPLNIREKEEDVVWGGKPDLSCPWSFMTISNCDEIALV